VIELEVIEREQLEVAEVGKARAEIVERDAHPALRQDAQCSRGTFQIDQQRLLGHLKCQPPRIEAAGCQRLVERLRATRQRKFGGGQVKR
jgi:hypothetical protein